MEASASHNVWASLTTWTLSCGLQGHLWRIREGRIVILNDQYRGVFAQGEPWPGGPPDVVELREAPR